VSSAPPTAPGLLESEFFGFADSRLAQVVQALQDIRTALAAGVGAAGAAGSVAPGSLPSVLSLPVTQLQLVQSILGSGEAQGGNAAPHVNRLNLSVPGNGSASFTNTVPQNDVWVLAAPLNVYSDLHDPSLTLTATIDGPSNYVTQLFPLVADAGFAITQFGVIRTNLALTLVNGTSSPANVTFEVQYVSVAAAIYDGIWVPTLTADYDLLAARASALIAAGYVPGPAGGGR
jgi:hypothetical protein